MTKSVTKQRKERCLDCTYLVEDENGNWVCDDCGKNVEMIPDHACSAEQDWCRPLMTKVTSVRRVNRQQLIWKPNSLLCTPQHFL